MFSKPHGILLYKLIRGYVVNITSCYTCVVVFLTTYPLISLYTHNGDGTHQKNIVLWLQGEAAAIFDQYCPLSQVSLYHSVFITGFVIILKCQD